MKSLCSKERSATSQRGPDGLKAKSTLKFPGWWWSIFTVLTALYLASAVAAWIGANEMRQQAGAAFERVSAIPDQRMTPKDAEQLNFSERMMVFGSMAGLWLLPSVLFFSFMTASLAVATRRYSLQLESDST